MNTIKEVVKARFLAQGLSEAAAERLAAKAAAKPAKAAPRTTVTCFENEGRAPWFSQHVV